MNTSAIVMLVVISGIFVTGITLCVLTALQRAKAESYDEFKEE